MPQKTKTIYVKDENAAIWEKAEELSGNQSLSSLIEDLLRRYVTEKTLLKSDAVVEFQVAPKFDYEGNRVFCEPIKKFKGRLIVDGAKLCDWRGFIFIALTQKGYFVIWDQENSEEGPEGFREADHFFVYKSLEQAYDHVASPEGDLSFCGDDDYERMEGTVSPIWPEKLFKIAANELRKMGRRQIEEMDI